MGLGGWVSEGLNEQTVPHTCCVFERNTEGCIFLFLQRRFHFQCVPAEGGFEGGHRFLESQTKNIKGVDNF